MAVDVGQALMLALAVPAMCLLLFVLTQVEQWLLKDDGPRMRGKPELAPGMAQKPSPCRRRPAPLTLRPRARLPRPMKTLLAQRRPAG